MFPHVRVARIAGVLARFGRATSAPRSRISTAANGGSVIEDLAALRRVAVAERRPAGKRHRSVP